MLIAYGDAMMTDRVIKMGNTASVRWMDEGARDGSQRWMMTGATSYMGATCSVAKVFTRRARDNPDGLTRVDFFFCCYFLLLCTNTAM